MKKYLIILDAANAKVTIIGQVETEDDIEAALEEYYNENTSARSNCEFMVWDGNIQIKA